jgi:hypothetical protein
MVQRDGCWVRQTTKWPNQVREELGFCAKPEPKWAEDRLARLVQECMAQADYRWQNRALAAWNRGEPLPPEESEEQVRRACMNEAATSAVSENENLKARLSELDADRQSLVTTVAEDRTHLRDSHDRIADALGEAAKKPAPAAVATATSNGTATTTSKTDQNSEATTPAAQPVAVVAIPGAPPAPVHVQPTTVVNGQATPVPTQPGVTPDGSSASAAPTTACELPEKTVVSSPKTKRARRTSSGPACAPPAKDANVTETLAAADPKPAEIVAPEAAAGTGGSGPVPVTK